MFPTLRGRRRGLLAPPPGNLDSWARAAHDMSRGRTDHRFSPFDTSGSVDSAIDPVSRVVRRHRTRSDQPSVRVQGSASSALALRAAASKNTREEAMRGLEADMFAASSLGPQLALLRTWKRFHDSWFDNTVEVFPITSYSLRAISAMFKMGGYASFRNYVYAAKAQHVRLGFAWTQEMDRVMKDCIRSVLRGAGPAKRSSPLDLARALAVTKSWGWNPNRLDRPVDSTAMLLAGSMFMMREIEIAGALQHEAHTLDNGSSVTLLLPASKKDPNANGVTRSLDCLCTQTALCPAHYLHGYLEKLSQLGDRLRIDNDTLPLFPNPLGSALTKKQVIDLIREVVAEYDPSVGIDELKRYTGHTFRISGARYYADLGLDPMTIGIHGRWSSNAILTYLAEAPLASMNMKLKGSYAPHHGDIREAVRKEVDSQLKDRLSATFKAQQPAVTQALELDAPMHLLGYVLNVMSKKVHIKKPGSEQSHDWVTNCGWKWAGKQHVYSSEGFPAEDNDNPWVKCPKCFKTPRDEDEIPDGELSSSDSSSSSSSS